MTLRCGLYFAIFVVQAMGASIMDVSGESSVVVHTGDTLIFHFSTWNFGWNAAALNLPANPTDVNFALVSGPLHGAGKFSATLESEDRTISVAFGNLIFASGKFQGSAYAGEVSTLQAYLHLAPLLSEALFSAPSAVIALRNQGPDLTLGLEAYALRQSLYASMSGGGLSVGAIPGQVELETRQDLARLTSFAVPMSLEAPPEVPEPGSGGLLLAGGILLCGLSAALARVSRR